MEHVIELRSVEHNFVTEPDFADRVASFFGAKSQRGRDASRQPKFACDLGCCGDQSKSCELFLRGHLLEH